MLVLSYRVAGSMVLNMSYEFLINTKVSLFVSQK